MLQGAEGLASRESAGEGRVWWGLVQTLYRAIRVGFSPPGSLLVPRGPAAALRAAHLLTPPPESVFDPAQVWGSRCLVSLRSLPASELSPWPGVRLGGSASSRSEGASFPGWGRKGRGWVLRGQRTASCVGPLALSSPDSSSCQPFSWASCARCHAERFPGPGSWNPMAALDGWKDGPIHRGERAPLGLEGRP